MIQVIKCPSCAAPLEIDGADYEKCDFCGSQVVISPQNTVSPNSYGFDGLLTQAQKLKEILYLARSGRKIEAIKIYRETFGSNLAESKEAVEKLVDGRPLNFTNFQIFSVNSLRPNAAVPFGQINDLSEIQTEIRRGNKIYAIKIYRAKFGGDLKSAKEAVERIERGDSAAFYSNNQFSINQTSAKAFKTVFWVIVICVILGVIVALAGFGVAIFLVADVNKNDSSIPYLNSFEAENSPDITFEAKNALRARKLSNTRSTSKSFS